MQCGHFNVVHLGWLLPQIFDQSLKSCLRETLQLNRSYVGYEKSFVTSTPGYIL
jgi:hypothetical protein